MLNKKIKDFKTYMKEDLSLKNLLIRQKTLKSPEKEIDITESIRIFLFKTKNINDNYIIKNLKISDCYIKEYKNYEQINYDLVIKFKENNDILILDIFNNKMRYENKGGKIEINYVAATDIDGAKIIFKILKEKIDENNITKLFDVKLKNIPILK